MDIHGTLKAFSGCHGFKKLVKLPVRTPCSRHLFGPPPFSVSLEEESEITQRFVWDVRCLEKGFCQKDS
ncbi:hypothetical protein CEXT_384861 [Caerostris extrusa]|uniref:Uncharacterized protein n=1 Tax=Caerostris extrusa TaxID=172846 RepID=A0AAV4QSR8_CAEEX|nr:hypothetical protein CEXT_384861 [Caerostris extrusa]